MPLPSLADVTEQEIAELAMSAGGLDLSHTVRRRFLTEMGSKDVQAAPGAGKTTLLGLKLRLIGRRWNPGMGALAVVTHTNVAKREIQGQLKDHPEAECLLRYPHFIDTLTQFAHQFLALPTCSGLGFKIQAVDTDIFKSAAIKALMGASNAHGWLANRSGLPQKIPYMQRVRAGAEKISAVLTVDATNPRMLAPPENLGTSTPTYVALQTVKATLNAKGLFSYEDMMAIANHALKNISGLSQAVAGRFPMLVLDEAQDTSSEAFQMLHAVRDAGAILQCIGDVNQAILANGASPAWNLDRNALDLDESKRFGPSIATVASKLSVHRPQQIVSTKTPDSLLYAFLFPDDAEHLVPAEYARIILREIGPVGDFWAVGHRRNHSETATKKQLVIGSYFPNLSPSAQVQLRGPTLHQAIIQFGRGGCGLDIVEDAMRQIVQHCCDLTEEHQRLFRQDWLLKALDRHLPEVASGMRAWISTCLNASPQTEQEWQAAQAAFMACLAPLSPAPSNTATCHHLTFCADPPALDDIAADKSRVLINVDGSDIPISVGTIASIKGQTHDATLILQTAFFNMKPFGKFAEALKVTTAKSWGPLESSLLANFYVAATRPRRLLAIAAETSQISEADRNLMALSGWTIVDIQAPPAINPAS